jgi:hypothetical protein
MEEKLRVTVVALLAKGVAPEDVQGFIGQIAAGQEESGVVTLFKTPPLSDGSRRIYIKVSRVIDAADLDDGWNLRITRKFNAAGYGNVAWKITQVDPNAWDAEITTASLPRELFQDCLEMDPDSSARPEAPPAPFGSEAFWNWFENGTR